MKALLLFLTLATASPSYAQFDYEAYVKEQNISCAIIDSAYIENTIPVLDSIEQVGVSVGYEKLLYDRSMLIYQRYFSSKNKVESDRDRMLSDFKRCWEDYQNTSALWNYLLTSAILGLCDNVNEELINAYLSKMKAQGNIEAVVDQEMELIKRCLP